MTTESKNRYGFAAMSPDLQRELASRGGKAAYEQGKAYEFTPETAREAGIKGGTKVSQNREHMARIGKLGGKARAKQKAKEQTES